MDRSASAPPSPPAPPLSDAATALPSVDALIAVERPEEPMHCLRPAAIAAAARRRSSQGFPGDVLYAVKCNPEPARAARGVGRRRARISTAPRPAEVALVRSMFPDAAIHFMHPVKAARRDPRGVGAARRARLRARQRGGAGEDPGRDRGDRRAPATSACSCASRCRRARRCYDLSGKFGADAGGGGRAAARRPAACRRGSACASMSARSASIRWPGATPWRWPAR